MPPTIIQSFQPVVNSINWFQPNLGLLRGTTNTYVHIDIVLNHMAIDSMPNEHNTRTNALYSPFSLFSKCVTHYIFIYRPRRFRLDTISFELYIYYTRSIYSGLSTFGPRNRKHKLHRQGHVSGAAAQHQVGNGLLRYVLPPKKFLGCRLRVGALWPLWLISSSLIPVCVNIYMCVIFSH